MSIPRCCCVLLLASACGGSGAQDSGAQTEQVEDCSLEGQLSYVHALVSDVYLWREQIPPLDPLSFEDPESLLEAMRYAELDHWSYVTPVTEYSSWFEEGKYIGLGFSMSYDAAGDVRFALVYPDSPAYLAGVRRGQRLVSVNGVTVEELDETDGWGDAFGVWEPGTPVQMEVEEQDGTVLSIQTQIDWVDIVTVLAPSVFELDGGKVGYLLVTAFVEETAAEVAAAFADFQAQGVDRMIVDLRFNGGGRMSASANLASHLVGADQQGEVFLRIQHNELYSDWDDQMIFEAPAAALGIEQVGFITSGRTASASETLMSGLDPWTDLVRVGGTTVGKPVGMDTWTYCDLAIVPISFRVLNVEGQTDYFEGFTPDCAVEDDFLGELGSPDERMLAAMLHRLETGECPASFGPALPTRPLRRAGPEGRESW